MALTPGCSLGRYTIVAALAGTAADDTYRAVYTRTRREVAIRVLPDRARDPRQRAAFLEEAEELAQYSHPSLALPMEIGEDEESDRLYVVFDDFQGATLEEMLATRRFSAPRSIGLAIQMADTIDDFHGAGFLHRTLQPSNIIVAPKGCARILYCGLACPGRAIAPSLRICHQSRWRAPIWTRGATSSR